MKKKWLKPEVKNLNLKSTNENIEDCLNLSILMP